MLQLASCDTAAALEQHLETLRELKKQLETERSKAAQAQAALQQQLKHIEERDPGLADFVAACDAEDSPAARETLVVKIRALLDQHHAFRCDRAAEGKTR